MEKITGLILAIVIAPIVGWPVWLALLALKRCFDKKTDGDDFTPATPEEYIVSLIETFGEAGYKMASKLEEISQKGKN